MNYLSKYRTAPPACKGFTLIEISIVLIIIGLITGGVLIGRDLIEIASIRAQISQIERYQTAVKTFQNKYNGLPGDLANAAQLGFLPRSGTQYLGDGNGRIENLAGGTPREYFVGGENVFFWTDLSQAGLVEGTFTDSTGGLITASNDAEIAAIYPRAKYGSANFVAFYSAATQDFGRHYFEVVNVIGIYSSAIVKGAFSPMAAYMLDKKIDDGSPMTGTVVAKGSAYNTALFSSILPAVPAVDVCVSNAAGSPYNIDPAYASSVSCTLAFRANF